ncbi:MAG TPA: prenyltransferase [Kiritimatiellia bacterium]|nr:prenyltransferase [Kiritimatiellia bacterium]
MIYFLKISRAPFLSAVLVPVLVGVAAAARDAGGVSPAKTALVVLTAALIHLGANLLNDWFDYKLGADKINPHRTPFSGGSADIAEEKTCPEILLPYAALCFGLAGAAGATLMVLAGDQWPVLAAIGAAGALLGISYTCPPLKLSWRGLGETAVFIAFGVLPVMASMQVLAGGMSRLAWHAAFPMGLLVAAIIWINEFPDHDSDKQAGKNTLVVKLGLSRARYVYHLLMFSAFASLVFLRMGGMVSGWIWLALPALFTAAAASVILHRSYDRPARLVPAQALTIGTHLLTGIALAAGIAL